MSGNTKARFMRANSLLMGMMEGRMRDVGWGLPKDSWGEGCSRCLFYTQVIEVVFLRV